MKQKPRPIIIPYRQPPIDPFEDLLLNGTNNARRSTLKLFNLPRTATTKKGKIKILPENETWPTRY